MNPAEYQQLCSPRLSHAARTLYWLYLRRQASDNVEVTVSYPELGRALAVEKPEAPNGFSFQVTANQLTELFNELLAAGLITLNSSPQSGHYHKATFTLPLLKEEICLFPLPSEAYPMTMGWRPDRQFSTLARLCGLQSPEYAEEELGEFIAYWLGQPEKYATSHQWMLKFIRTLKATNYTKNKPGISPASDSGTPRLVKNEATDTGPSQRAIEMIEEAARLRNEKGESDEFQ